MSHQHFQSVSAKSELDDGHRGVGVHSKTPPKKARCWFALLDSVGRPAVAMERRRVIAFLTAKVHQDEPATQKLQAARAH